MSLEERFWAKVAKGDACWEWTASRSRGGYGQFSDGHTMRRAHRVAYELVHGPIVGDEQVLHSCDNRGCVNPNHLRLGSAADNVADMHQRGREARGAAVASPGSANPNAKLSDATISEIREIYAAGGVTQSALGKRYGVGQTAISKIVRGATWTRMAA